MNNALRWITLCLLVLPLANCGRSGGDALADTSYCGVSNRPGHRPTKVLVVIGENESAPGLVSQDASFQQGVLRKQCGSLDNMHGLTHGSEPNYLALTSGGYPQWALCDYAPDTVGDLKCPYAPSGQLDGPSIFSQMEAKYGSAGWRSYMQSMPGTCQKTDGASYVGVDGIYRVKYVARHNPAVFFSTLASCPRYDVPSGDFINHAGQFYNDAVSANLPRFSLLIPDNIQNGHDTSVRSFDGLLAPTLAFLRTTRDYQSGALAIVITYDEGSVGKGTHAVLGEDCLNPIPPDSAPSCHIAAFVVGRYMPHISDQNFESHYSLLKTIELWAQLPLLGHAADPATQALDPRFNITTGTNR
jgi:hypothetical protein